MPSYRDIVRVEMLYRKNKSIQQIAYLTGFHEREITAILVREKVIR